MSDELTRREFSRDFGAMTIGSALIVSIIDDPVRGETKDSSKKKLNAMQQDACDFQTSYMTWDLPPGKDPRPYARHKIPYGNMARIQLEALIDVFDEATGKAERFVLIAACRTEWVYAEKGMFQLPSNEYRNIYSLTEQRSMGRRITTDGTPTTGKPVLDTFRSLKIDVQTFSQTRALTTPKEIVKATTQNVPLVGRTEIHDLNTKQRYVLEYPIKTMNFQPRDDSFQVDTGPVLVPNLRSKASRAIESLEMAHIVYNRLDRAEFILRSPTPVNDKEGKELCKVLHYSEIQETPARTIMLAGDVR